MTRIMENHSSNVLEFNKIVKEVSKYATSKSGKERIVSLHPSTDYETIYLLLEETRIAESIYRYTGKTAVMQFEDIRGSVSLATKGGLLSSESILQINKFFYSVINIIKLFASYSKPTQSLGQYVNTLGNYNEIKKMIMRCIDDYGNILDAASATLSTIRRNKVHQQERISSKVNSLLSTYSKYLQESIVTQRNNRYVIPVKQEHRGAVKGIVHDQSASGATLFIEPQAIVDANNQLKALLLEEEKEIERILRVLGEAIAQQADEIECDYLTMVKLDVIFAKAMYAKQCKANEPTLSQEPCISIVNGRHPLIPQDQVVPITVSVGINFKGLVITGPNTGGKTVTLKTIGLFAMMAQSGLFLPADSGCVIGPFKNIFADIGDEQSIEQNLSTFSSHIKNISTILRHADSQSLVLLDELGAGTDPAEGAALAISILEELFQLGSCIAATTHYSELKVYSSEHEKIENASMEFSVETLRPTYRLIMGVTGKSNAFEISKRIGLKTHIIEYARKVISRDKLKFDELNDELERIKKQIVLEKKKAMKDRDEALKLRTQGQYLLNQQKKENAECIQKAKEEALEIVIEAKEKADKLIREIQQVDKASRTKEQNQLVEKARKELSEEVNQLSEATKKTNKILSGGLKADDLKLGREVYVQSLGQHATIASKVSTNGELFVQAGIIKVKVNVKDLQPNHKEKRSQSKAKQTGQYINTRNMSVGKKKTVKMEFDIRGMTAEDAMIEVDQYIDDAFLSGLKEVVIVHGKGTGRLRSVVNKLLKQNKHVEKFRLGEYGEGDTGVTVATLK